MLRPAMTNKGVSNTLELYYETGYKHSKPPLDSWLDCSRD